LHPLKALLPLIIQVRVLTTSILYAKDREKVAEKSAGMSLNSINIDLKAN
jgi:hypothetical protein